MQLTQEKSGSIEIEGDTYLWELRSQPRPLANGDWEGITLTLRHQDFKREAIVQFPPPLRSNGRPDMEKQKVDLEKVRNAIVSSIEAGWEPTSRGKAMVFDVDVQGN